MFLKFKMERIQVFINGQMSEHIMVDPCNEIKPSNKKKGARDTPKEIRLKSIML